MASCATTYKKKFDKVAQQVLDNGDIPINPAVLPQWLDHDKYMPICLAMVDSADAILMIGDWQNSKGAKLEKAYAEYQGKKILYEE